MTDPNIPVGIYKESQFTRPRPDCPHPERYTTHDIQGTEIQVIEMVAGMIRGLQPDTVLETGTSRGFMAKAVGRALLQNGRGVLHSYEVDEPTWLEAVDYVHHDGELEGTVVIHNEPSMSPWEHGSIDFAWFDSHIQLREQEFDFYRQFFHSRTVVGFHDTAPHFGDWSHSLMRRDDLRAIRLPTPRGVIFARWVPPF